MSKKYYPCGYLIVKLQFVRELQLLDVHNEVTNDAKENGEDAVALANYIKEIITTEKVQKPLFLTAYDREVDEGVSGFATVQLSGDGNIDGISEIKIQMHSYTRDNVIQITRTTDGGGNYSGYKIGYLEV